MMWSIWSSPEICSAGRKTETIRVALPQGAVYHFCIGLIGCWAVLTASSIQKFAHHLHLYNWFTTQININGDHFTILIDFRAFLVYSFTCNLNEMERKRSNWFNGKSTTNRWTNETIRATNSIVAMEKKSVHTINTKRKKAFAWLRVFVCSFFKLDFMICDFHVFNHGG